MRGSRRSLTRRDFVKVAGTGVAGMTLLGAATGLGGCRRGQADDKIRPASPTGAATPALTAGTAVPANEAPAVSPAPPAASGMNVILVIIDTLRRDHVGAFGGELGATPSLDALAAESLRFNRAHPEAEPTIPARRAIHTGMHTWSYAGWVAVNDPNAIYGWTPIPSDQSTVSEILLQSGYETLLVSDVPHEFKPGMNFARGFRVAQWVRGQERDDYQPPWLADGARLSTFLMTAPDGTPLTAKGPTDVRLEDELRQYLGNTRDRHGEADWFAPQVFGAGMNLLDAVAQLDKPFFLVVDSFDPHEPWDPPPSYVERFTTGSYRGSEPVSPSYGSSDYLTDAQLERMRALYAAELAMTDQWLGRFLNKAADLELLDNSLLLLISDHGMALGEHGAVGKPPWALWSEMTDVPFVIRHPQRKRAGEASDYFASTHDVVPTILGSLGIEPPAPLDGQDLSVLFDGGEPEPRSHMITGYNHYIAVRDDQYVLIARNDRQDMKLYDMQADPGQQTNLAGSKPDVVDRLFAVATGDVPSEVPAVG